MNTRKVLFITVCVICILLVLVFSQVENGHTILQQFKDIPVLQPFQTDDTGYKAHMPPLDSQDIRHLLNLTQFKIDKQLGHLTEEFRKFELFMNEKLKSNMGDTTRESRMDAPEGKFRLYYHRHHCRRCRHQLSNLRWWAGMNRWTCLDHAGTHVSGSGNGRNNPYSLSKMQLMIKKTILIFKYMLFCICLMEGNEASFYSYVWIKSSG